MQATFTAFVDFTPTLVHTCLRRVRRHLDAATWASTVGPADLALQPFQPAAPHHGGSSKVMYTPRLLTALTSAAQIAGPDRRPVLAEPAPVPEDLSAAAILAPVKTVRQPVWATDLDTRHRSGSDALSPDQLDDLVKRSLLPAQTDAAPIDPLGLAPMPPLLPMGAAHSGPDLWL